MKTHQGRDKQIRSKLFATGLGAPSSHLHAHGQQRCRPHAETKQSNLGSKARLTQRRSSGPVEMDAKREE